MKGILNKIFILSIILCMAFAFAVSCKQIPGLSDGNNSETGGEGENNNSSTPSYKLELSASKTDVARGDTVTLAAILKAEGAEDMDPEGTVYTVTVGADIATVAGNVLTVLNTAKDGDVIKVKASEGATDSNEITLKVSVPAESIVISASGVTNILAGQSVVLSKTLLPEGCADKAVWTITEGADAAVIAGDILVVNANAQTGKLIKIKAVAGALESNELVFTVGYPLESLAAVLPGSANIKNGNSAQLAAVKTPANATDASYAWVFVEGDDYASVSGDIITVNEDAPIGSVIKLKAVAGNIESNVITIVVGIPIETIAVSSTAPAVLDIGGIYPLSVTVTPTGASASSVNWVIVEGGEYASVTSNILSISSSAPAGTTLKLYAESGSVKSNELSFSIGVALESIEISAIGSTEVVKGNTVGLSAVLTPSNASASLIEWVITEGSEYAYITSNTLVIKSDAATGASVKVKAVIDTLESNELEFTVKATQEELDAAKYLIDLSADNLRIDKKGTSSPTLVAEIYNGNYEKVTGLDLEFSVSSGAQYLAINANGSACTFTALGHGIATVEIRIAGTDVVETATVEVIVPPDAINLPEVFGERTNISYAFSMVDPATGEAETLPFVPTVRADALACQDYEITFTHEDGTSGDEVAVYENGNITFKKTGIVTLNVRSASGSRVEAYTSYKFDINEGYNVHTFAELWQVLRSTAYTGKEEINLVVLEKPDGSATGYTYGYDIVPPTALLSHDEQTVVKILRGAGETVEVDGVSKLVNNRLQAINKGIYLNGNNHKIDGSQMRVFTSAEYDAYCEEYGVTNKMPYIGSLLSSEPWSTLGAGNDATVEGQTHNVKLYNIEVVGNCPIDYDPTLYSSDSGETVGVYTHGISIGSYEYLTYCYLDADNVTSSRFKFGASFASVVGNGKVSNIYVYNCYSTGIMVKSSIMTFENIKFGLCGATGIELSPECSAEAGVNDNLNQNITITGTVDASANLNDGSTNYFTHYTIQGTTIPTIITGNTNMYTESQVAHIRNDKGQFIFVALIFNDMSTLATNTSEVTYPDGIINIEDINGTDTTHKYIRMNIYVTLPGLGNTQAGSALFYNQNYVE